ncbi:MAG: glucosaminidase domain-containing protein [Marinoscillum sp.]
MKTTTFTLIVMLLAMTCKEKVIVLKTESVVITSPDDIVPLGDSTVAPILYQNIPSFEDLTVEESKQKFIAAVLPAILIAKYRLDKDREEVKLLVNKKEWTPKDSSFYNIQVARFDAKDSTGLLSRMQVHPNSIVLVQAIVESGWGSSRFFQEANNLFGIWSYHANEPRIKASLSRGENKIYLRKYADVSESITDYFETVGRSRAYRYFRKEREKTDDVSRLLPHLRYYSERRDDYVNQLKTIIAQNDLTQYDDYQIDSSYMVEL